MAEASETNRERGDQENDLIRRDGQAPLAIMADRASAVLVGQACGNALGVGYEFRTPPLAGTPRMLGAEGRLAGGEWSENTQIAICLAEVAVTGIDLTTEEGLDAIASRYLAWYQGGTRKVDAPTRVVLETTVNDISNVNPARKIRSAAAYFHMRTRRTNGSGALSRCAILGLTRIKDPQWTAESVRAVTELTHVDSLASEAAIIYAEAIRRAVTDPIPGDESWASRINLGTGIALLASSRREQWREWLQQAEETYFKPPRDNTYAVPALQAVAGILRAVKIEHRESPLSGQDAFRRAVSLAVQLGGATDAIAGLVGALFAAGIGLAQVPADLQKRLHGWPGLKVDALAEMGVGAALAGVVGTHGMAQMITSAASLTDLIAAHPDAQLDSEITPEP